jgi:hypothetical protein
MTKLRAVAVIPDALPLVAAPQERDWMEIFPSRHASRCLPLTVANCHGWEILSSHDCRIGWNGGMRIQDLTVECADPHFCESHFSSGIVTFRVGYIFRTDPGWNLFVTGPINRFKDGAAPLSAVIETDWLPYTFTMNWRLTRPGFVEFKKDEPLAHIMPIRRHDLDDIAPEIVSIRDEKEIAAEHDAWRDARDEFMRRVNAGDAATIKQGWQRFYYRGGRPGGPPGPDDHVTKLRLSPPIDRR